MLRILSEKTLGPRHFFHDLCIGTKPVSDQSNRLFLTYTESLEQLGHTGQVEVLKVDIEGELGYCSAFQHYEYCGYTGRC